MTNRASVDDGQSSAQVHDQAALQRALQRRRVLEELIISEESYVADLKVLLHVRALSDDDQRLQQLT